MDNSSKLQALLGDKGDSEEPFDWNKYCPAKPQHLYEGTDSDDDEIITSRRVEGGDSNAPQPELRCMPEFIPSPSEVVLPNDFKEYQLQIGELASEDESFCPFQTIKKYPYVYIGNANRQKVSEAFFDHGKLYERVWDFFYLYRSAAVNASQEALILVPTKQLKHFLQTINNTLNVNLTLPSGAAKGGFQVTFENDGTPRPRYLGRANNREMAEALRLAPPPSYYKLDGETDAHGTPSQRSLIAFKTKIELMLQAQKGKKLANKEKQKAERIAKQQTWNQSIKRVQRYLGIRQASQSQQITAIRQDLENSGLGWGDYDAAVKAAFAKLPPNASFDPEKRAPYAPEGSVVFICVDVEAYERNNTLITEIGIATLDTEDLITLVPGEGGANWLEKIRTRHFRINEYKHLNNTEFVDGCANRFEFGESEFINLKDAPQVVASCFKYPFSNAEAKPMVSDIKRPIILVGHDVVADINYLRAVGYDVHNLSNLQEIVDTASMWRYVKRDTNPRNLGSILAELDLIGWNLHNAGNDAAYTLQAMVRIAIKDLKERQKVKGTKENEMKERVAESVKEATMAAYDREQGWSSCGENSDGGPPLPPAIIGPKKSSQNSQAINRAKISDPWRQSTHSSSNQPPKGGPWEASKLEETANNWASPKFEVASKSRNGPWRTSQPPGPSHNPEPDESKLAKAMKEASLEEQNNKPWGNGSSWDTNTPSAAAKSSDDINDLLTWA